MRLEIREIEDKVEWDGFITSRMEANFLQSYDFGEFHVARGKRVVRRAVFRGSEIVGAYTGVVETAKRGRYMAIAGGPLLDFSDKAVVSAVFEDIRAEGERLECVFVRVRPQEERSEKSEGVMRENGFRLAPMHLSAEHAGVIDLRLSEEEILAGMSQRVRRALRKAEKAGISIEKSMDVSRMAEFYAIQMETAKRHGFVEFSEEYLTKQFEAFARNGEAVLYVAKLGKEILAENFMIFYGAEASYHYGVSTEMGTKLSGAPLLHMEAMRDARERGLRRYNFWGIVEEDDTEHRFYGVSQFKRGFGVSDLRYIRAHDMVLRPLAYKLNLFVENARKRHRKV